MKRKEDDPHIDRIFKEHVKEYKRLNLKETALWLVAWSMLYYLIFVLGPHMKWW